MWPGGVRFNLLKEITNHTKENSLLHHFSVLTRTFRIVQGVWDKTFSFVSPWAEDAEMWWGGVVRAFWPKEANQE